MLVTLIEVQMKNIILIIIIGLIVSCDEKPKDQLTLETDYFEFKNDYWVNLHHFLYQKADSSQLRKLQQDGLDFIDIGEAKALAQLSVYERAVFEEALQYYNDSITIKILIRELNGLRHWLQGNEGLKTLADTSYGKKYTDIMNRFSPIYDKYFWNLHKNHNNVVLNKYISIIDEVEEEVMTKMEGFSMRKWPDSTKVRVDLTAYANYAGGYQTSKPENNIVLSTLDPLNNTASLVETIMHEGAHVLYPFGESPIRDKIYYKSKEMGIRFHRQLYHANMMYLGGLATHEALTKRSIQHNFNMEEKNIFSNYTTSIFKESCGKHYKGEIDADSMIVNVLNEIKENANN